MFEETHRHTHIHRETDWGRGRGRETERVETRLSYFPVYPRVALNS